MSAQLQLQALTQALHRLRSEPGRTQQFVQMARSQTALTGALLPRYQEVLQQLLDRLESSVLFSEESCSFSQKGLLDSLQLWTEKTAVYLGEKPTADG
jgi:hypothetical protein